MDLDAALSLLERSSPFALLLVDPRGEIWWGNARAATLFGAPEADALVGLSVDRLVPADLREVHAAHRDRFFIGLETRPMGFGEARIVPAMHLDGERRFHVRIDLTPIQLAGRQFALATVQDSGPLLAENRRLRHELTALRAGRAQSDSADVAHLAALELAQVMLVELDASGRVARLNQISADMLGRPMQDVIGQSWFDVAIPDAIMPVVRTTFDMLMAGEVAAAAEFENEIERSDGTRRTITWHNQLLRDADGQPMGTRSAGFDVTERRAVDRNVREAIATTHAALREQEAFSYSVAHDLMAPVRTIRGFAEMLVEDWGESLHPDARHVVDRIGANAEKMADIVFGLLQLSHVSRAEMHWAAVNVSEVARECISSLRDDDPDREVEAVIQPDLRITADRRLVRVLLQNLLANAWKFTGNEPRPRIEVGCDPTAPDRLFVRDNGVGFDPAFAARMFEPFERLHRGDFPGTGVGLATCRRAVARHHGTIRAEGAPGEGATIWFTLHADEPPGPADDPGAPGHDAQSTE
ncbi:MAG: sensor histidine kinase [Planctomycetota bacterium]